MHFKVALFGIVAVAAFQQLSVTKLPMLFLLIFAHGCDITSMGFVGSLMALTHSILINLFIKVKLNTFSPTSPARY